MKEAAGEANMTVITIILITAVVAVATPLITNLMNQSKYKTCCISAGGDTVKGKACSSSANITIDSEGYNNCIAGKLNQ